jgi:hypothetical protein
VIVLAAESKQLAAVDASEAADRTRTNSETAAVIATIAMPTSFTPNTGPNADACRTTSDTICLISTLAPSQAIQLAIAAVRRAGLMPGAVECQTPPFDSNLDKAMGTRWTPCRTTVETHGKLTLSLVAFPLPKPPTHTGGPITFNPTLISIEGQLLP